MSALCLALSACDANNANMSVAKVKFCKPSAFGSRKPHPEKNTAAGSFYNHMCALSEQFLWVKQNVHRPEVASDSIKKLQAMHGLLAALVETPPYKVTQAKGSQGEDMMRGYQSCLNKTLKRIEQAKKHVETRNFGEAKIAAERIEYMEHLCHRNFAFPKY